MTAIRAALFVIPFVSASISLGAATTESTISKLEQVNSMRESLAATLDPKKAPITEETFKQVCVPVAMSLKQWAQEEGAIARQVSHKFRNPAHKAEEHDLDVIREMQKNKDRAFGFSAGDLRGVYSVWIK